MVGTHGTGVVRRASCAVVLGLAAGASAAAGGGTMVDPGAPWPRLRLVRLEPVQAARDGEVTALAVADFDTDGARDLAVAWRRPGGTVVGLYAGRKDRPAGAAPFRPAVVVAGFPEPVDLLAAADVNGDGYEDLVMGREGGSGLLRLAGAPGGPAGEPERIVLPGKITALAGVDHGRRDLVRDLAVGLETPSGPALFLLERGPLDRSPRRRLVAVPGTVRDVATGNLDGDGFWDLALATDAGVVVMHGADSVLGEAASPARVELVRGASPARAVAADFFHRGRTREVVAATEDGVVGVVPGRGTWELVSCAKTAVPRRLAAAWLGAGRGPAMVLAAPSGLELKGDLESGDGPDAAWRPRATATVPLDGEVRALWAGRLGRGAMDDLLVAVAGRAAVTAILPAPRTTFTVTTEDDHDDGHCDADCTLREAFNAANASSGPDAIVSVDWTVENFSPLTKLPDLSETVSLNVGTGLYWYIDGSSCSGGGCNGVVFAADACSASNVSVTNMPASSSNTLGTGFLLFNSYHSSLVGVTGSRCDLSGIQFYDSSAASVKGTFEDNGRYGIYLAQGVHAATADNHFPWLSVGGNGWNGIKILNVPDTMIGGTMAGETCVVTGNGFAGIDISGGASTGTTIFQTTSTGNGSTSTPASGLAMDSVPAVTVGRNVSGSENRFYDNTQDGITIWSSSGATVITNSAVGTNAVEGPHSSHPNSRHGIGVFGSSNLVIGPGNRISANGRHGIELAPWSGDQTHDVTIEDNVIGDDDPNFGATSGNGWFGVDLDGAWNIRLGSAGHPNIIGKNGWGGIRISGSSASANVIAGNFIGVDSGGAALPNQGDGVLVVDSPDNIVGGQTAPNVIARNTNDGIGITSDPAVGINCRFNSIHHNGGQGIDLWSGGSENGPDWPPDAGDVDEGPNHSMNMPVLMWAESCGGETYLSGWLATAGHTTSSLDFYRNASCDASGFGEGRTWVASLSLYSPQAEERHFRVVLPVDASGEMLTALSTGPFGSSSEFSNCRAVTSGRPGDTDCDCTLTAADLAGILRTLGDTGFTPPCDPDADQNGQVEKEDLPYDTVKIFY